jgi:hypothetical protein
LDRLNMHVLHQAVDVELTQVERGALDASAVAVNAAHAFGTCETEAGPSVACVWDLSAQTGPVALPTLGGLEAHAEAMNAKGMGVGWSQRAAGGEHATLWPLGAGLPIDLTPQSDNFTIAYAINARNTVVGSGGNGQAFRWTPEAGLQLIAPLPGDIASRLTAVNDAGLAVGTSVGSGPPPGPLPSRAVRLVARHLEDLNPLAAVQDGCKLESAVGVSPRGVIGVAGHCQGDAFPHAWLLVPRQGRHE